MAAFYTLFTGSLRTFYGAVYEAFMTSRARGVMLARVLKASAGGALPDNAGEGRVAVGRRIDHDHGGLEQEHVVTVRSVMTQTGTPPA
jgi:hypothetical protein